MKKLLSVLLAVAMVIGLVGPVVAVKETNVAPVVTVTAEEESVVTEIAAEEKQKQNLSCPHMPIQ